MVGSSEYAIAFACVQTTPLGRDVVPEVYCPLIGAPGSGARAGTVSGSPASANQDSSRPGCYPADGPAGSAPRLYSRLSREAAAATALANRGCVIAPTGSLSLA